MVQHTRNDDLKNFPEGVGTYTKALLHGNDGIVDPDSLAQFLKACAVDPNNPTTPYTGSGVGDFEDAGIKLGGSGRLNGPQGAFAGQIGGKPSDFFGDDVVPKAFDLDSKEYWVELVELYWGSLLRDVPFREYPTNPFAIAAANELTSFGKDYKGPVNAQNKVTPELLFRGGFGSDIAKFAGERDGPYLSQLCMRPAMLGALSIDQKLKTFVPGMDFMTKFDNWLHVQKGVTTNELLMYDDVRHYLRNGRDTAAYTHSDELYQAYLVGYLVCTAVGITPDSNPQSPYHAYKKQKPFGTFGGADITGVIGAVARAAIEAVWYQKWRIHLRHRPEYGGGLVHLWQVNKLSQSIRAKLKHIGIVLNSKALALSNLVYGSWLLSQAFPEGSPTHPAYPTGHGAVAGACITALKFFLDGSATFNNPVEPSSDGLQLEPYNGPPLTLNGELHKLAHNISFGHGIHAGIHWRSDTDYSLLLGEAVAAQYLKDLAKSYHEKFSITITLMNGKTETFP